MVNRRTISSRVQTEKNLRILSNAFLTFTNEPVANIRVLINSLGEMLNAAFCLYNKPYKDLLITAAAFNPPPQYSTRIPAKGRICSDVLRDNPDRIVVVRDFDKSQYAQHDPAIKKSGWKTSISKVVELSGKPIGVVCVLFSHDFTPTSEEEELIGIISSAISVQESLQQKIVQIRDREHKLQTLIDNSPNVAIQSYDLDGQVKYWNKASESFYGFTGTQTKGRSLAELILDKDGYDAFRKTLKRIDETGETITSEWICSDKGGKNHHILSTMFAILPTSENGDGKDFICMDVDLTDLKNAEIKLKQYTSELENANATKDKFFSIIAHDLKNPFNTILGFSRILCSDYKDLNNEEVMKFIRVIRDSSENAYKLVENLLVWSRIQSGHIEFSPEPVSLNLILNETLALLKPQAISKNITVASSVDPSIQVYSDENMIKTIFRNLISNALKYSYNGGRVEVRAIESPSEVLIEVADNGIGMSPEIVSRLFRIGESVERPGTANELGTGLGLILCKEFLQKHESSLAVKSETGKGSVFSFILSKTRIPS